jgi:ABC-type nitrate/sulfonate/bicarbonate transport system permease component
MRALFGILQAILGLAIITLAWAGAAAILQDSNKLPSLAATLNRAFQLATSDDYRQHINASTSVLLTGVAAGIVLGIVAGISTVFRWLLGPLFITLAAAPLIALMPLLLLWLGLGPTLTVVAVAIITVFPVANAVMMALAMQQGSVALAIVRGLRWGAVFGATALVICEMLTSRVGVGTYIMNAGATFNVPNAAAGIVLVFVPIIVVVALLQAIEEQLAA